ncbi:MAG: hypothetical protein FWB84_02640 [Candidatus Bathyarchaeota archaeon]|uniref:hypothetical protein n=1 Tax=Candidatus Bathycorpusculum sp. TaxID=2994959 RepID=UPI0028289714|nr:hypothetical protein [Candidatus Termiticorpusculum sp.]MCL2257479.1 hypothetical protein [Candidatus Termiticorpusculum sp.]
MQLVEASNQSERKFGNKLDFFTLNVQAYIEIADFCLAHQKTYLSRFTNNSKVA